MDSKGRIVLPKEVRERLGITPGTEVGINEEDGKAIIEPETTPNESSNAWNVSSRKHHPSEERRYRLTKGLTPLPRNAELRFEEEVKKNSNE